MLMRNELVSSQSGPSASRLAGASRYNLTCVFAEFISGNIRYLTIRPFMPN